VVGDLQVEDVVADVGYANPRVAMDRAAVDFHQAERVAIVVDLVGIGELLVSDGNDVEVIAAPAGSAMKIAQTPRDR
jgi:hypothetical protein